MVWNLVKKTVINIFAGSHRMKNKKKNKIRLIVFQTGHDERMPSKEPMEVTLSKPIKPGFRRSFTVGTDEAVDKQTDGSYAKSEVVEGDSSAPTIEPTSTDRVINGWINGDGSVGAKKVRVTVDGHVGEGDVSIALEISYNVASADATEFVGFTEGADEPIPAPTPV